MDPKKRKIYDRTGEIDNFNIDAFETAYEYYRSIYKQVTDEDIQHFAARYIGSPDEDTDLTNFYKKFKGDMLKVLEHIPLSANSEIPRYL